MATAWSAFFPNIVPELPGAPLPLIEHHIREAVREFCESTLFWRETFVQSLIADAHTYFLVPDVVLTGDPPVAAIPYLVQRINRVNVLNVEPPLDAMNETALDAFDLHWRTKSGEAFAYLQPAPNQIRIVYTPTVDVAEALSVEMAVKPLPNAPELFNDDILDHHLDDIAAGVKAAMMLSPRKTYSDPAMGKMYSEKFKAACGAAATRRARDYTRLPMRVRGYDR
ncbi:MAG: hypothetical protein ACRD0K_26875 [Egibacteraceae bacterium]